jgi:hypothetical protein
MNSDSRCFYVVRVQHLRGVASDICFVFRKALAIDRIFVSGVQLPHP